MNLIEYLIPSLMPGRVTDVRIGPHWTAVVVEEQGVQRCGLASTVFPGHNHSTEPDVPQAGALIGMPAIELANYALGDRPLQTGLGIAAINALIPPPAQSFEMNAEEMIARLGAGKQVALVGHFPFISRLRGQVGSLTVLEQNPEPGDLPAATARDVIPNADIVAITGMTIINHTIHALLDLCAPQAVVMILGPSTPLSPILYDHHVDVLSGSIVENVPAVLQTLSQGGNFRQIHRAGVKLVTIVKPALGEVL